MKILFCAILGFLLGSLSPSNYLAKRKNEDFKHQGTGNMGATNTMIILGKGYGFLVMILDMLKAYLAVKIAKIIAPTQSFVWLLSGTSAVFGHIYSPFLRFKGGKGLASFGGMILAYDPAMFLFMAIISISLIFITNYGVAMPMSAGILFPVVVYLKDFNLGLLLIALFASTIIIIKHWPNLKRAIHKEDATVRDYIQKYFSKAH